MTLKVCFSFIQLRLDIHSFIQYHLKKFRQIQMYAMNESREKIISSFNISLVERSSMFRDANVNSSFLLTNVSFSNDTYLGFDFIESLLCLNQARMSSIQRNTSVTIPQTRSNRIIPYQNWVVYVDSKLNIGSIDGLTCVEKKTIYWRSLLKKNRLSLEIWIISWIRVGCRNNQSSTILVLVRQF